MKHNITQIQFIPASLTLIFQLIIVAIFTRIDVPSAYSMGGELTSRVGIVGEWIGSYSLLHPVLSKWMSLIIIALSTFSLCRATSRLLIYGFSCYIIIPLAVLSMLGQQYDQWLLLGALIYWLMVEAISLLFRSVNPGNIPAVLFNSALYLGAVSLIYAPAVTLWLAIPVLAITLHRTFREFVVMMCGVVLPSLMFLYVRWMMGFDFEQTVAHYHLIFSSLAPWSIAHINPISIAIAVIFGLLTSIAIPLVKVSNLTQRAHKRVVIAIVIGLLAAPSALFCPCLALLAALLTPTVALLTTLTLVDIPKRLSMVAGVVLLLLYLTLFIVF